uniref:ATP synthase epsilon chain, chloroplastic n=1 Tax=Colacium vesiculosum TaxID=102910 RepID=I6NIR9_9EUGL|nr:ATPase epsilon subunit [Colacium vesiculosum]
MNLEVSIIIPDRIFWKDDVKEIILPTLSGQMGVLKGHIPLLTGLDIGLVLVRTASQLNWISIVVTGGFALINNDKITILVNEAELGSTIKFDEAESSFLASKLKLENVANEREKLEANAQFKKARARFMRFKIC